MLSERIESAKAPVSSSSASALAAEPAAETIERADMPMLEPEEGSVVTTGRAMDIIATTQASPPVIAAADPVATSVSLAVPVVSQMLAQLVPVLQVLPPAAVAPEPTVEPQVSRSRSSSDSGVLCRHVYS